MRIVFATGTRADWGLLQPLAALLRDKGADVRIFACHQHLMPEMGDTLREIVADGFVPVEKIPATGSAAGIMAMAATGFAEALPRHNPDAIVILGDRCEMLGAASAAMLSGVPIVHIAGGTISEGALDDSVRHAITKMATLHLTETDECARRIVRMGEDPARVVTTGAPGVYNTLKVPRMSREALAASLDGWNPGERFLLATLHAATLADGDPATVQRDMLAALASLPAEWRFLLTYPNSDVDPTPLIAGLHDFERDMRGRAKVVPSLGRVRYISAAALASGVVGNSSSALVEVPSLGTPSLDIGTRQKGRQHGPSVIHCGITAPEIGEGLRRLLSPDMRRLAAAKINPYARPDTPQVMARAILQYPFSAYPAKRFYMPAEDTPHPASAACH